MGDVEQNQIDQENGKGSKTERYSLAIFVKRMKLWGAPAIGLMLATLVIEFIFQFYGLSGQALKLYPFIAPALVMNVKSVHGKKRWNGFRECYYDPYPTLALRTFNLAFGTVTMMTLFISYFFFRVVPFEASIGHVFLWVVFQMFLDEFSDDFD